MSLQLYNTLTGKKEEFKPINPKEVRVYTCGPTVYNYAHIGNLRSFVFADVLKRTLRYNGYKVKHVMNITDVGQLTSDADDGDDKMVKGLKREGLPTTLDGLKQLADKYTSLFIHDLKALNVELPDEMPRASEHIKEDIELIEKLEQKGVAYRTSDGMYFDVSKFPAYGTRGGFKLGEQKEGARVEINKGKHTPRDFALWKFSTNDIGAGPSGSSALGWESSWGKGFPGWHIECSAMSRKYLGQPFDIHTGGIDLIPTHHQNEIAQSETAYDAPLATVWMHSEHINIGEAKMAKSGENFITLQTLKDKGIHPLAYRYYLLSASYRTPVNLNFHPLDSAQKTYVELLSAFALLEVSGKPSAKYIERFVRAINNDLNTAEALSLVYAILGGVEHLSPADKRATILDFDKVLGLDIENQSKKLAEKMNAVPEDIKKLASEREKARKYEDFNKADDIREQIQKEGFEIMDTDSGPLLRKKI